MTLVAHFDFDLYQMDVKMTFLNGNLEENVYMKQLEGFSSSAWTKKSVFSADLSSKNRFSIGTGKKKRRKNRSEEKSGKNR